MSTQPHVPERGDLPWTLRRPSEGTERVGRQRAVVLSPGAYNTSAERALVCPIARQGRSGHAVRLPPQCAVQSLILADQVHTVAWMQRATDLTVCLSQPCGPCSNWSCAWWQANPALRRAMQELLHGGAQRLAVKRLEQKAHQPRPGQALRRGLVAVPAA